MVRWKTIAIFVKAQLDGTHATINEKKVICSRAMSAQEPVGAPYRPAADSTLAHFVVGWACTYFALFGSRYSKWGWSSNWRFAHCNEALSYTRLEVSEDHILLIQPVAVLTPVQKPGIHSTHHECMVKNVHVPSSRFDCKLVELHQIIQLIHTSYQGVVNLYSYALWNLK